MLEFRGEVVRCGLADLREARYRADGHDCFLFNLQQQGVLDSTFRGHFGRFINHCCLPSMYTKVGGEGGGLGSGRGTQEEALLPALRLRCLAAFRDSLMSVLHYDPARSP